MKGLKLPFVGLLFTLLTLPLLAMESPAPSAGEEPAEEPVEEINVVGQRTILALRLQMEAAQEEVHLLFNELNPEDSYDIVCVEVDRYFSRMKEKQCKPRFAWDALETEGQNFARSVRGENVVQGITSNTEIGLAEPGMREHFVEALSKSPELFDAIVKHAQLMEKLAEAQATYFGEEE
jgi:hypothetical protein